MSRFESLLLQGNLAGDGLANEVVQIVRAHPQLLPDLFAALASETPAVRGHAADALEKVARSMPREVAAWLPQIVAAGLRDELPMVRWHMAMLLGHLSPARGTVSTSIRTLVRQLADPSPFVRSWAITSLCRLGREYPSEHAQIAPRIAELTADPRPSVAKRAQTALRLLMHPEDRLPTSWVKAP